MPRIVNHDAKVISPGTHRIRKTFKRDGELYTFAATVRVSKPTLRGEILRIVVANA